MELLIKARNLEINERTRTYIQKRFTPLGRRLRGVGETKVEVRREPTHSPQERVIVQVTVNVNGTLLRAEERGTSVTAVVDAVAKALDRQVLKYKGRHYRSSTRKRRGQIRSIRSQESPVGATAEEEEEPEATVLSTGKVVRIKQFPYRRCRWRRRPCRWNCWATTSSSSSTGQRSSTTCCTAATTATTGS